MSEERKPEEQRVSDSAAEPQDGAQMNPAERQPAVGEEKTPQQEEEQRQEEAQEQEPEGEEPEAVSHEQLFHVDPKDIFPITVMGTAHDGKPLRDAAMFGLRMKDGNVMLMDANDCQIHDSEDKKTKEVQLDTSHGFSVVKADALMQVQRNGQAMEGFVVDSADVPKERTVAETLKDQIPSVTPPEPQKTLNQFTMSFDESVLSRNNEKYPNSVLLEMPDANQKDGKGFLVLPRSAVSLSKDDGRLEANIDLDKNYTYIVDGKESQVPGKKIDDLVTSAEAGLAASPDAALEADETKDHQAYEEAFGRDEMGGAYLDEEEEGGVRHYQGAMGDFVYDPKEFEIRQMRSDKGSFETLHYIGKETDGANIQIPEGVRYAPYMFTGTGIKSAPKLPESLESGNLMFAGCDQLTKANVKIPQNCKSTMLMFSECPKLEKGPTTIPGNVKNMDYMFNACPSLKQTPRMSQGVETADCAFANCRSLQQAPHMPSSMKSAKDATFGCTGIDKTKDEIARRVNEKARAKYEKKLNSPGLVGRVTGVASAIMQTHALRKMGVGAVMAPYLVHKMRKNGELGKDLSSGIGMVTMYSRFKPLRGASVMLMNHSANKEAKRQERVRQKMDQWDMMHDLYSEGSLFNVKVKQAQVSGAADQKSGLFARINKMDPAKKEQFRQSRGLEGVIRAQEDQITAQRQSGVEMTESMRHAYAAWYKDQLRERTGYIRSANEAITSDHKLSAEQRRDQRRGLAEMQHLAMDPLMESMVTMQRDYNMFNYGDQREIDSIVKDMTGRSLFSTDRGPQRTPGFENTNERVHQQFGTDTDRFYHEERHEEHTNQRQNGGFRKETHAEQQANQQTQPAAPQGEQRPNQQTGAQQVLNRGRVQREQPADGNRPGAQQNGHNGHRDLPKGAEELLQMEEQQRSGRGKDNGPEMD